ncbi:MAG TPA: DUF3822 family protein [Bacteroidia bacterium]
MADAKTIPTSALNFTDEAFDIKRSDTYHLSILTDGKNHAFSILDTISNKYLVLRSCSELPDGHFKSVSCAIAHNKFTLVPAALFDEENKKSFLGFNHEIKDEEEIFVNTLHTIDAKNIFTVPKSLTADIRKRFPNAHFIHSSTAFLDGLLAQHKNNTGKRVFANFTSSIHPAGEKTESYFEIALLEGKELLFSNVFKYKTPEEIAYYVLFVYEQLDLNPDSVELILSGEIEKTAKEHTLLYTYIRNIRFAVRPEGFSYSYKFEEIPNHNFFSLFTQYLVTN